MVYLDYNASTPVDQRVLPSVVEAHGIFANPASAHHSAGRAAAELMEEARSRVALLVRRPMQDVIFTSGASEAASLGLLGVMLGASDRPNIVVSATEHKAILAAAELAVRLSGGEVRRVAVDKNGLIDLHMASELVDGSVAVAAVMAANNETGVISPVDEVHEITQRSGAYHFVDATQLIGKGSLDNVVEIADLLVLSSHKIYGPKGAGALVASRHVQKALVPIAAGGGQERGLRGGTPNTPSVVGFGHAAELTMKEQADDAARMGHLARELLDVVRSEIVGVELNASETQRLSNTLNVRFVGADAEAVMASMPNVLVSAGSACQSAVSSPSHVLLAMGMTDVAASESLRISLGRPTTRAEIRYAACSIANAVARVRELSSE